MTLTLTRHPDTPCAAVERINVDVTRPGPSQLLLHYVLTGAIAAIRLPPAVEPSRADALWKHTCFEAFLRPWGDDRYLEINAAPSTQWAAYAFDGYRAGMRNADGIGAVAIDVTTHGDSLLHVRVTVDLRAAGVTVAPWPFGLSAVIEETNGATSYWALAHAPGKPDFHHPAAFAASLAAELRP